MWHLVPPLFALPHQQQHEVGEDLELLVHVHAQHAVQQAADVTPRALLLLPGGLGGEKQGGEVSVNTQQAVKQNG